MTNHHIVASIASTATTPRLTPSPIPSFALCDNPGEGDDVYVDMLAAGVVVEARVVMVVEADEAGVDVAEVAVLGVVERVLEVKMRSGLSSTIVRTALYAAVLGVAKTLVTVALTVYAPCVPP